jgi:hypothetical protein
MMPCIFLMHSLDSGAVVSVITVYTCAPNCIGAALYGACCGFDGAGCWYLRRDQPFN